MLFDLLTALLDSWSLWNRAAGSESEGYRWRQRYLLLTYGAGTYRPYEDLVREAAAAVALPETVPETLLATWDQLDPWPEVGRVLRRLAQAIPIGVVTNCSEALAARAVARLGASVSVVVSAERAGAYKPDARPYRLALSELGQPAERVAFVAGSPFDLSGAAALGMPVFWHNRLGLARPDGIPAPLAEADNLIDLLDRSGLDLAVAHP